MEKILLAVGFRELEEFLQKKLRNEYKFVGVTVYREGIIRAIGQTNPDIVVIRETLEGKENILSILYEIRTKFPRVRIVFIAGKREPGDELLATLVNYGIYDILYGEKIPAHAVVGLIRKPNEYKDVQHLQPKPVLDEKSNKVLFESPEPQVTEREIVKEVYVVKEVPVAKEVPGHTSETPVPQTQTAPPVQATAQTAETEEERVFAKNDKEKILPWAVGKREQHIDGGKQKIVTFLGAKPGVGNTSVSLNTAIQLAKKNIRVIFVEFDDRTPSASYWFDLGNFNEGIDSALQGLKEEDYQKVQNAIIRTEDLLKENASLQDSYKRFPRTLDFLFFSKQYLTRTREDIYDIDLRLLKELCLYLAFQMGYDYVILDLSADIDEDVMRNALLYSSKVFMTITQDVCSIGHALYLLNELFKQGISVSSKLYYIINRYEEADLNFKGISEWVESKKLLTVPCLNKDFINANYFGLPVILYSKNRQLKSAFRNIETTILGGASF